MKTIRSRCAIIGGFRPIGLLFPVIMCIASRASPQPKGLASPTVLKDQLDPSLDDSTLSIGSMNSVVFSTTGVTVSHAAANFPWAYDPKTRTVTLLAGNAAPSAGGTFVLQAQLKTRLPFGTLIPNQTACAVLAVKEDA